MEGKKKYGVFAHLPLFFSFVCIVLYMIYCIINSTYVYVCVLLNKIFAKRKEKVRRREEGEGVDEEEEGKKEEREREGQKKEKGKIEF